MLLLLLPVLMRFTGGIVVVDPVTTAEPETSITGTVVVTGDPDTSMTAAATFLAFLAGAAAAADA